MKPNDLLVEAMESLLLAKRLSPGNQRNHLFIQMGTARMEEVFYCRHVRVLCNGKSCLIRVIALILDETRFYIVFDDGLRVRCGTLSTKDTSWPIRVLRLFGAIIEDPNDGVACINTRVHLSKSVRILRNYASAHYAHINKHCNCYITLLPSAKKNLIRKELKKI